MQPQEDNNPIRLYREAMVLAIAASLTNTENDTLTGLFSNFDTLPIARRVVSFLPLPVRYLEKKLCDFVGHRLAACAGTTDARSNTIIRQSTKYAQEHLKVGLFLGTLEHCVQVQGGNFWQRYAPRKVWEATFISGSSRRCETVWEFTPVIHAGTHVKITVPPSSHNTTTTTNLISVILEEELKAGHFIWLREWLNRKFNSQLSPVQEAVQAILEVVHYSAEQVHLQAVAYPYNGDFGFLNHHSYTVTYRNGWRCQWQEYDDDDDNDDVSNNNNDDDWLREIWDMYVKPLSPWSTAQQASNGNDNGSNEASNDYSQFWKLHLEQHVTLW